MGKTIRKAALYAGLVLLCGAITSAYADTISFNFNSLSASANNTAVQNYMNGQLQAGEHVTVTGAKAGLNYNGDGHVVGPCDPNGSHTCHSTTLAADGGGNFIINASPIDTITMAFTGLNITHVSFDLEIFPDGTCPKQSTTCDATKANWPDFEFFADNALIQTWLAANPGDTAHGGSVYIHSPNSHYNHTELAPQLLVYDVTFDFPDGVTELSFKDWPATVGIDDLVITTPEPSGLMLLGTGLIGLAGLLRRKMIG